MKKKCIVQAEEIEKYWLRVHSVVMKGNKEKTSKLQNLIQILMNT